MNAELVSAARDARLVIFAGAGASMGAPTNLPSWRDVNRIVVRALAASAAPVIGDAEAKRAAELVLARHAHEKLPPEYQAQLLAELLHDRYFEVLRLLDSDRPNATHLAIAWLARLGCVRAVITLNFDRVLEAAFAAVGVPLERHFQPEHFRALADDLARFDARGGACQLLKLHGSVDDSTTLIDTLAQRKRGFAPSVMKVLDHLLGTGHWVFLGFSGLDLEAEPNYLGLAQAADSAAGFTWMVREGTEPKPAVVKLRERYGDRGTLVSGNLPDWLLNVASVISPEPRAWIADHPTARDAPSQHATTAALERGARDWANGLDPRMCAMSIAFLVAACAEPHAAVTVVESVIRSLDARLKSAAAPSDGLLLMHALAANALGILLAGLGRHEEALRWLTAAVASAEHAGDPDSRDRCRGNLAVSLETIGRVDEAREMYQSAVAGYRTRDDLGILAFGLTALASHCIRQFRFGEARALAGEAVAVAAAAGDERQRGTALHDLAMIAKLTGDSHAALAMFAEVETLFTRLGNDDAASAAAGNRGEVLVSLGKYHEAEAIFLAVLQVNQRVERRESEGATYLSLGLLARERGDLATSDQWYSKALEVFRAIKDPSNEAITVARLARIRNDAGQFAEAIALAQAALPLVSENNEGFTLDLWNEIARANMKLGFVRRAEDAYRKIIALADKLGVDRSTAGANQNLGTLFLLEQRDEEAATAFAQAAEIWKRLGQHAELEYCTLGESAVTLDARIAALSNAGHARSDPAAQHAAAAEMVGLYPDLIAMYEKIGARQLVAAFCASAASTARFAGELAHAIDWYRQAAMAFHEIGLDSQAVDALESAETLLQQWANALMRKDQLSAAAPILVELAKVSDQLGNRDSCARSLLNAAIATLQTSNEFARARSFASQALPLFAPDSDGYATAQKLIALCDTH
ncbi:MAG: tetratricopeptide repeat protein [Gemmatimonadota bacterium]|nr:tetratricopeptide repeat protein [Gemmatimonadota bacterium]